MTREERELSIEHLEKIKEDYIEGDGYERHPLPEYYAIESAIKALEQESILDKIRAEIEDERSFQRTMEEYDIATGLRKALDILDKHKTESEG